MFSLSQAANPPRFTWCPNPSTCTGLFFYREGTKAENGGPNWWPSDSPIGFSQLIEYGEFKSGEICMNGNVKWRLGQKPVALYKDILDQFSRPGDLVADLFCGTGGFLQAAMETGRFAIGIDIDAELLQKVVHPRLDHLFKDSVSSYLTKDVCQKYSLVYETVEVQ